MSPTPRIAVAMGSHSDWNVMQFCCQQLDELQLPFEARVVSAHRTPNLLATYTKDLARRNFHVLIAAAGGAAHLPGMLAAHTLLPVLGVPIETSTLRGLDSLLSIVQMPRGVPVGSLAIGKSGAINAALLAAQILAQQDVAVARTLAAFRKKQTEAVLANPRPDQDPGAAF